MPELPEVENAKLSLIRLGAVGQTLSGAVLRRKNLRKPFPRGFSQSVTGQTLLNVHRRAKFLLLETELFFIVSHLGMTGSWRQYQGQADLLGTHDHVVLNFSSGLQLVYNDPRRFGLLDLIPKDKLEASRWFYNLGVEPLSQDFTEKFLFQATRGVRSTIKALIMDQKRVVGVGNIYASEALFMAQVKPTRLAHKLTMLEAKRLVDSIRSILARAILAGGSTIKNYRNSEGKAGEFQNQFKVYGRKGEACMFCGAKIKSQVIAGRNAFWCPKCQH